MKDERLRILTTVLITILVIGCLLGALGFYLQVDAILRSGALEALTGESTAAQESVGRVIMNFSIALLALAMVLAFVRQVLLHGWFSPFSESRQAKALEVIFALLAVLVLIGDWLAPPNSFFENWSGLVISALILLFVGARLWIKPEDQGWRERELLAYAVLIGIGLLGLLAQILT